MAQPLQFSVSPAGRKRVWINYGPHTHPPTQYGQKINHDKTNLCNAVLSVMPLTVCMVSGCHVCSGAAVDDCVCSQVGELGESPQQPSSIWLHEHIGERAVNHITTHKKTSHKLSRGQQDHAESEREQTYPACYSDNLHVPFSLCLWSPLWPQPDL